MELNEACSIVQDAAHEDANIIFGTVMDETLGSAVRVTVIATGFPSEDELRANEKVSLLKERNPGLLSRPAMLLLEKLFKFKLLFKLQCSFKLLCKQQLRHK